MKTTTGVVFAEFEIPSSKPQERVSITFSLSEHWTTNHHSVAHTRVAAQDQEIMPHNRQRPQQRQQRVSGAAVLFLRRSFLTCRSASSSVVRVRMHAVLVTRCPLPVSFVVFCAFLPFQNRKDGDVSVFSQNNLFWMAWNSLSI